MPAQAYIHIPEIPVLHHQCLSLQSLLRRCPIDNYRGIQLSLFHQLLKGDPRRRAAGPQQIVSAAMAEAAVALLVRHILLVQGSQGVILAHIPDAHCPLPIHCPECSGLVL